VIGLGVGLDAFARGYATYGLLGRPGALPAAMVAAWATNFTWILGLDLLPLVLLLFPDGYLPTRRRRPLAWLILVLAVVLPLEGAVSPESLQPFLANPIAITGGALGWLVEAFGQVGFPLFLATLPLAALALALRFRRARGWNASSSNGSPPPG
jgi:two-component system, NarL family, sensor kinase